MKNNPARQSGIVLIDKPTGISSANAVAQLRRALGKPKVGHLGTLDPFASGLLPLCVGEATKIAPFLNVADKAYTGTVELGLRTDTLDGTGEIIERTDDVPDPRELDLQALAAAFTGAQEQIPPAFSAIKKDGVPMYKLAREGRAPALEARSVTIHALEIAAAGPHSLDLTVSCSKGTYIRSLARDLGERLGCGATLIELRRTVFGDFDLSQAIPLAEACSGGDPPMLGLSRAVGHLPAISIDTATAVDLRQGRRHRLDALATDSDTGEIRRLVGPGDDLVAVIRAEQGGWTFERVFAPNAPSGSCAPGR